MSYEVFKQVIISCNKDKDTKKAELIYIVRMRTSYVCIRTDYYYILFL